MHHVRALPVRLTSGGFVNTIFKEEIERRRLMDAAFNGRLVGKIQCPGFGQANNVAFNSKYTYTRCSLVLS